MPRGAPNASPCGCAERCHKPSRSGNSTSATTRRADHAGDTSEQRRVVIILVLDSDEKTDVDQALRAAMARESERAPIFETLLTKYSLATGPAFTWVD